MGLLFVSDAHQPNPTHVSRARIVSGSSSSLREIQLQVSVIDIDTNMGKNLRRSLEPHTYLTILSAYRQVEGTFAITCKQVAPNSSGCRATFLFVIDCGLDGGWGKSRQMM